MKVPLFKRKEDYKRINNVDVQEEPEVETPQPQNQIQQPPQQPQPPQYDPRWSLRTVPTGEDIVLYDSHTGKAVSWEEAMVILLNRSE